MESPSAAGIQGPKQWDGLCFQGGGAKGMTYISAVEECIAQGFLYLEGYAPKKEEIDMGKRRGPRIYSGASVGSLFALMFYLETPLASMRSHVIDQNLFASLAVGDLWTPMRFATQYGACTTYKLEQYVKGLLNHRIQVLVQKYHTGPSSKADTDESSSTEEKLALAQVLVKLSTEHGRRYATFRDLHTLFSSTGYPRQLLMTSTNMNRRLKVYLTADATPNLELFRAVAMSMAYPGVFVGVAWGGDIYMDGGLMDNFPMQETQRVLESQKFGPCRVLGFQIVEKPSSPGTEALGKDGLPLLPGVRHDINSFHDFLESMSDVMMQARDDWKYQPIDHQHVIYIETERGITALAKDLTLEDRKALTETGREAVAKALQADAC
jgi:predicted acylesterase/phospholipase RssA